MDGYNVIGFLRVQEPSLKNEYKHSRHVGSTFWLIWWQNLDNVGSVKGKCQLSGSAARLPRKYYTPSEIVSGAILGHISFPYLRKTRVIGKAVPILFKER